MTLTRRCHCPAHRCLHLTRAHERCCHDPPSTAAVLTVSGRVSGHPIATLLRHCSRARTLRGAGEGAGWMLLAPLRPLQLLPPPVPKLPPVERLQPLVPPLLPLLRRQHELLRLPLLLAGQLFPVHSSPLNGPCRPTPSLPALPPGPYPAGQHLTQAHSAGYVQGRWAPHLVNGCPGWRRQAGTHPPQNPAGQQQRPRQRHLPALARALLLVAQASHGLRCLSVLVALPWPPGRLSELAELLQPQLPHA